MIDSRASKLMIAVIALIVCIAFLASFFVMITNPDSDKPLLFGQVKLFDFENQTSPLFEQQQNESINLNTTNSTG